MYRGTILCFTILISLVNTKTIFKNLKNKQILQSAAAMGSGIMLSELSWSDIDSEFSYLEARVASLEELYHDEISETMNQIHIIHNSVYPIFSIFILGAVIGIVILSRKIHKDDLVGFLAKASRIPEYLNRIRNSNIFTQNQNTPSAPYPQNHEILPHRQNPYFNNGYPIPQMTNEPIMPPSMPRNNATLEQGNHGSG